MVSAGRLQIRLDGRTYDTQNYYLFDNETTDVFGVILSTSNANGRAIGYNPTKMLDYTTDLPEIGDKVYAIGSSRGLENTLSKESYLPFER